MSRGLLHSALAARHYLRGNRQVSDALAPSRHVRYHRTLGAVRVQARTASLRKWAPLPVVLAGVFMVVLDFFIVNVAMPTMHGALHACANAIQWVVAGYGLAFAAGLITGVASAMVERPERGQRAAGGRLEQHRGDDG
jgi:hypothetical protein